MAMKNQNTTQRVWGISGYHDLEDKLVYYNHRYDIPKLGCWTKRDPIAEEGGLNLYGMVGNDPIGSWDSLGLQKVIVVADRSVGGTAGAGDHYSLEFWDCKCSVKMNKEYTSKSKWTKACGGVRTDQVELLADTGWTVWASKKNWYSKGRHWGTVNVWISIVKRTSTADDDFMAIHDGPGVTTKWNKLIANALKYKWAEQDGVTESTISKWPRSKYKSFQTNSNTFVRNMVSKVGLKMKELSGNHPGNKTPSQNSESDIYGNDYYFFSSEKPWKKTPRSKPARNP